MKLKIDRLALISTAALFLLVSLPLFNNVYYAADTIIDEAFHLPQGLRYCSLNNFTYWDPKITTLPGLYIVSALLLAPLSACTVYNLRLINLLAASFNLCLIGRLLLRLNPNKHVFLSALSISLLPPLYFFSHVYYTDVLSMTSVLLLLNVGAEPCVKNSLLLLFFGLISILFRQTNVVWVAFVLGKKIIDYVMFTRVVLGKGSKAKRIENFTDNYSIRDFYSAVIFHLKTRRGHRALKLYDFIMIASLLSVLVFFLIFLYVNGSIVVGDKSAHSASLHVPQLFYFLLFWGFFSVPNILQSSSNIFRSIVYHRYLALLFVSICLVIVHFNTLIHPYLLADNRHYTFYVWNKFYGKYWFVKYAMVPVYTFLLFALVENIKYTSFGFVASFSICILVSLVLQKMIEVRYFFIPYVILKLNQTKLSLRALIFEILINLFINILTLRVFFTKEIYWDDFDAVQRLIW